MEGQLLRSGCADDDFEDPCDGVVGKALSFVANLTPFVFWPKKISQVGIHQP
jgi:hypothetical protein